MEREILLETLKTQQDEAKNILKDAYVPRAMMSKAIPYLNKNWAIVISGVRRCGKSAFAHQLLSNHRYGYVNFDDERFSGLKATDLQQVFEAVLEVSPGIKYLLFDEIQNIKGWELFINRLLRGGYRVVITGSNAKLLSQELATHLTGRTISFELFPFSFAEFLAARREKYDPESFHRSEIKARMLGFFDDYLKTGGFPDIAIDGYSIQYLQELFDRILTKDVAVRKKMRDPASLKEIALYLMSQPGSRHTFQKITKTLGISNVVTVKNMVLGIEESYLLFQVKPFSYKVKEILKLPRKYYAIDPGMQSAISIKAGLDYGTKLEHFVFLELRRRYPEVYYYLDQKFEIDFLIREGRSVETIVQACHSISQSDTLERELNGLTQGLSKFRASQGIIITSSQEKELHVGKKKITALPAWKWALMTED